MALSDRLTAPPKPLPACGMRTFLERLHEADKVSLRAALADDAWSTSAIHRALVEEGYKLGLTTVQRHRKGMCSCVAR